MGAGEEAFQLLCKSEVPAGVGRGGLPVGHLDEEVEIARGFEPTRHRRTKEIEAFDAVAPAEIGKRAKVSLHYLGHRSPSCANPNPSEPATANGREASAGDLPLRKCVGSAGAKVVAVGAGSVRSAQAVPDSGALGLANHAYGLSGAEGGAARAAENGGRLARRRP
jgi:hypothetical protein